MSSRGADKNDGNARFVSHHKIVWNVAFHASTYCFVYFIAQSHVRTEDQNRSYLFQINNLRAITLLSTTFHSFVLRYIGRYISTNFFVSETKDVEKNIYIIQWWHEDDKMNDLERSLLWESWVDWEHWTMWSYWYGTKVSQLFEKDTLPTGFIMKTVKHFNETYGMDWTT